MAPTSKEAFDQLCDAGEAAGPASDEAIKRAEATLGLTFPEPYRDFLSRYGSLVADGLCVYGLLEPSGDQPPFWSDVVLLTHALRGWGQAGTEDAAYFPFSDEGTGVYFFLNASMSPETEIWAVGPGVRKRVATDFYEFVVDLSAGRIEV